LLHHELRVILQERQHPDAVQPEGVGFVGEDVAAAELALAESETPVEISAIAHRKNLRQRSGVSGRRRDSPGEILGLFRLARHRHFERRLRDQSDVAEELPVRLADPQGRRRG
jgi:hypothetical protein